MADGYLNFDTRINEKGFNTGINKLGNLGKSGLSIVSKAMTGAVAAVGTATSVIIKSSLDVVANMEQQVGGVETLFKDSADTVIKNANRAYKTAQVSANDYMSTVTSFSASLLQGLGGDTAKAAEIADMALIDMADNANKMGTNMRDIQNAYQGFAKQNYTMLDNLKLGYGGTQSEMIRLINDSGILNQKISDLDNVTFDQMIQAIHVVQQNLGITGTSAEEAGDTIEGSVNSAKAAWENFQGGVITSPAAGHCHLCLFIACQKRTDEIIGCAHFLHALKGRLIADTLVTVNFQSMFIYKSAFAAHFLNGMTDISNVLNTGKILQYTHSGCHYRRRNNSYRRVFRTADGNLSGQSFSAPYN